ncbi:MAG: hypothetical protein ACQEWF_00010 [Bacillota bacterium]
MLREYFLDAVTSVETLGVFVILVFVHFLITKDKKMLTIPFVVLLLGYVTFIIGIVFIRGWTGMGWMVWGNILMAIGLLFYLGVGVYSNFRKRRKKLKIS